MRMNEAACSICQHDTAFKINFIGLRRLSQDKFVFMPSEWAWNISSLMDVITASNVRSSAFKKLEHKSEAGGLVHLIKY